MSRAGVICTELEHWSEQRRFILKNLREFGFSKNSMEELIHEDINELIENFTKQVGLPISTHHAFNAGKPSSGV